MEKKLYKSADNKIPAGARGGVKEENPMNAAKKPLTPVHYVVIAYLIFWTMVLVLCGGASMIFHASPLVMRLLSNLCAWSPTFVALALWGRLRPGQRRLDFVRDCFAERPQPLLLLLLAALIAGASLLSVWLLSLWEGKPFGGYFSLGGYPLWASFFLSLLSGPTGEELGWRGYLRQELGKRHGFVSAALIQGTVWTFWHTVLWFVDSDFSGWTLLPYIASNWIVMTSLVFVMNAVLERHNNLLYSVVIHFAFNFVYCFLAVDIRYYLIMSAVYALVALGTVCLRRLRAARKA